MAAKGTFLPSYIEIDPVVSDKNIFKVFYVYKGEISPASWRPCFLTIQNGLNNLGRGSPKEHFCKIILKSVQWFLTRRVFKFSVKNLFLAPVTFICNGQEPFEQL